MITTIRQRVPSALAPLFLLAGLVACGGTAPATTAPTPDPTTAPAAAAAAAAATITADDMAARIRVLAHDSMAGRDTPSPELERSAAYLAAQLEAVGLQPAGEDGTFIDRFDYNVTTLAPDETFVRVSDSDDEPTYGVDYFLVPPPQLAEAPAFYMGVAGEAGPPPPEASGRILVYQHPGAELNEEWQGRLVAALQPAMGAGAPGVILILSPDFPPEAIGELATATAQQQAPFALVGMAHDAGTDLVAGLGGDLAALEASGQPTALGDTPLSIQGTRHQQAETPPNVVAMLPGSDSLLNDTYIVITAHFDHVGVGQPDETGDSIFNGADDNASGTAAVLEVAEAFAALDVAPARSMVFLFVSGEEKGLLGSQAWVENPTVPISGIVANINLDMVGRNAPDTVIGIGQEYTTLEDVVSSVTTTHPELGLNVILDPKPEEMYFFRSDQLPFIQQGIPAVFFTTGEHDDYHQQSDEAAKIEFDKAARVARLAFYLAHAIATSATAPEWTAEGRARVEEMLGGSPF